MKRSFKKSRNHDVKKSRVHEIEKSRFHEIEKQKITKYHHDVALWSNYKEHTLYEHQTLGQWETLSSIVKYFCFVYPPYQTIVGDQMIHFVMIVMYDRQHIKWATCRIWRWRKMSVKNYLFQIAFSTKRTYMKMHKIVTGLAFRPILNVVS